VCVGGAPVGRKTLEGSDAMAASEAVVGALLDLAGTDYRAALRSLITAGNPQMSEDEMRERTNAQVEYAPAEPSVARLRAWTEADSIEEARALGGRLWLLYAPGMAGPWLPQAREYGELLRRTLPEANTVEVDDGWVTRPDQCASVVRRLTTPARTAPT
jgi:hypothetical protein